MEKITPPMPAKRALAALDQPAPAEPVNNALRITNKVRAAVDLMVASARRSATPPPKLARESLSRALSKGLLQPLHWLARDEQPEPEQHAEQVTHDPSEPLN
jgi:hypothetical protein